MLEKSWTDTLAQTKAQKKPTLLIVDDDPGFLQAMAIAFTRLDYNVVARLQGQDFIDATDLPALLKDAKPDCVLTDFQMGMCDGIQVADAVKQHNQLVPVVLHTNAIEQLPGEEHLLNIAAMRPKPLAGETKAHCESIHNLFSAALENAGRIDLFGHDKGHAL